MAKGRIHTEGSQPGETDEAGWQSPGPPTLAHTGSCCPWSALELSSLFLNPECEKAPDGCTHLAQG